MIKSMTGLAHRDIAREGLRYSVEIKSYNNRYLDLSIFLPPYLSPLEPKIRAFLAERIVHGKVEASIRIRELDAPVEASADLAAAKAVAGVLREVAEACSIEAPLSLSSVVGFEGVVSFEALLRWNSKEHGKISPAKFIPLAEDTRLIVPIGEWVLQQACVEATRWPEHVRVAVNVSGEQLLDPNFTATIVGAVADVPATLKPSAGPGIWPPLVG